MMELEHVFMLLVGWCAGLLVGVFIGWAAYNNGVTDGFGYSREPCNKSYEEAGNYLKKHMKHRWPELGHDAEIEEDGR